MILDIILGELFDQCILSHEIVTKNGKTETVIKLSSGKTFYIETDGSVKYRESCGPLVCCAQRGGYFDLVGALTRIVGEHEDVVRLFKMPEAACLEPCGLHLQVLQPSSLVRGSLGAAGFDIACNQDVSLPPGVVIKVPTGIHVAVPKGHVGLIMDRSSMGSKGITVLGGVIDSDYRGELKVMLLNTGNTIMQFHRGDRVAQMIVVPCVQNSVVVESLEATERGSNGFGSTGV